MCSVTSITQTFYVENIFFDGNALIFDVRLKKHRNVRFESP